MITVLIVEDSRVVSDYLNFILSQDPDIQVIGTVGNGKEAIDFIRKQQPDIISMDIDMPVMNGLEATRVIMSTTPIPILIVTASRNVSEMSVSIEALAAGALGLIEKPLGIGHPDEQKLADELVTMIKVLAEVKVIARRPKQAAKPMGIPPATRQVIPWVDYGTFNLVVIGISSGGPQTLLQVFSKISEKFPTPILVVQHIAEGFLGGLISWLGRTTAIPIQIATNGELLVAGRIYFAPDLHQMGVTRNGRVVLEKCHRKNGLCPSVAHLFESAAREFGKSALGIILTGMGQDGAQELKMLRETGAVTIAQDKKSSLIHGMPGVAIQLDAAKYILSAEEISQLLFKMETNT